MRLDGTLSDDQFRNWINDTKKRCSESGHLDVALTHIGNILIYCPSDPDGLWFNRAAAEILNANDAEKIRDGFYLGILNSRGAHFVDPTAKPEYELAAKYRQQAEDIETTLCCYS